MYLAIDCECNYNPDQIGHPWNPEAFLSTIAIYDSDGEHGCWAFRHREADPFFTDRAKVKEIQEWVDQANRVIGHNLKYDYNWLEWIGVKLNKKKLWDTMIVEYLLSAQTEVMPSLDSLAEKYLGENKLDVVKLEYWEKGVNTDQVPLSILSEYNIKDCELTLRVAQAQQKLVQEAKMSQLVLLKGEEIKCVAEIERSGLKLDENVRQKLEEEYGGKLASIVSRVQEIAGRCLNLNSPEQLSALLFGGTYTVPARLYYQRVHRDGSVGLRSRNDKIRKSIKGLGFQPIGDASVKGQYSTDVGTLIQLQKQAKTPEQKEVVALLLERSSMATLMKTFIVGIKDHVLNGIVHCDLNQTITATGRFSSSSPNLQNLPRDNTSPVKEMYISRLGYFVEGDAKSLEWVVGAFLSQCPVMMKEIWAGRDPHTATGEDIFHGKGIRTDWKIYNFRYLYGGSPYAFYMDHKMPNFSLKKWEEIHKKTKEKYYGHSKWVENNVKEVYRSGGYLRNPTGRLFKFDKVQTKSGEQYRVPQIANYPVQSLATGDIVPLAMVHIQRRLAHLSPHVMMCNQVHDSIMYDCKEEHVDEVARTMLEVFEELPKLIEQWFGFPYNLPMTGEIKTGKNWKDMEKWKV